MCGICGGIGNKAPDLNQLHAQLRTLEHRGPDDYGIYTEPGISLAMCRLAIVEISSGKQPASDLRNQVHLVWNGEIYNYREIRDELFRAGVSFESNSESEVIIKAYLNYGLEFVNKLNGMFAIALFDSRIQTLHLIRDRMGKKPIWYTEYTDGSLVFASEVKAILRIRKDLTFRAESISEVMQLGYIASPNSAFEEVKQLPPGSILSWHNSQFKILNYWKPIFEPKSSITYEEALEKTEILLEQSVARRLISERPLGSFLSGGYDSTIVTALMARNMNSRVQTYSIGFTNSQFDESKFAEKVAKYLETEHHTAILKPDPAVVVEEIASILDQPFADSSIVPTYLLSRYASEKLVVALTGDGGDEVFGGYERYLITPLLQKFNHILPSLKIGVQIAGPILLRNDRKLNKASSQFLSMQSLGDRYLAIQSLANKQYLQKLISTEYLSDVTSQSFVEHFIENQELSNLDKMVSSDFKYYLPGDILTKIDLASMACSLELRSPMLDVEIVEWASLLPEKFRIKRFETKHILKDLARKLVPSQLIDRPKMGFGIPRAEWLRTGMKDLVFDTLTDSTFKSRGWFNHQEIDLVITEHMQGSDKDSLIWPILMLELWARNWLD